jgi:hypothetical protein
VTSSLAKTPSSVSVRLSVLLQGGGGVRVCRFQSR